MKRRLSLMALSWLVLLIPSAVRVAAQPPPTPEPILIRNRVDAENWRLENIRKISEEKRSDEARKSGAPAVEPDAQFYRRKLTEEQKRLLAATAEEKAAHRDFLRQDHTGLIRLLPRGKYEFNATVAADHPNLILPIKGGGAFYSFIEKKHPFGPWSEISLQDGRLVVGFQPQSLAVMTMLGDVPLESLTATTPGIAYLAHWTPPTERAAAHDQNARNFKGFVNADRAYNSTLPAIVHQTYALRTTIYKKEGRLRMIRGVGSIYVPHPYEYGGADELIVFRILSAGEDGSVTLLWKRLQKFSPPKIEDRRDDTAMRERSDTAPRDRGDDRRQ